MELPEQVPQDIKQVQADIERCNYHLHTLFDIGKDIFGILDTELILKNSLLFTLGNFGVIEGFIGLYDSLTKQPTQFVSEGFQQSDTAALKNGAKKTLIEIISKNSAATAVSCSGHDLLPDSVNCVLPFKVDEHHVGTLGLGSKLISDDYTSDEKKLLVTIVNNMVVALQNARSFAEIKDLNQDLLENKKKLETTLDKLRIAVRKKAKYSSIWKKSSPL
ncbi:MAG: GAF domain-containing protein [bacterium]|nr:GAF domain-containing protein [bacterium]